MDLILTKNQVQGLVSLEHLSGMRRRGKHPNKLE